MSKNMLLWLAPLTLCVLIGACASGDSAGVAAPTSTSQGSDPATQLAASAQKFGPAFDPSDFVAGIDHPFLGFTPGKTFSYAGETEEGLETIEVVVTSDTKEILGVTTTVVHDRAYLAGELVEDTFDWYAQDKDGNVWYFGEDSKTYEGGLGGVVVSTEGSWEAGVNGALPGILMPAVDNLKIGETYQQEFAADVAEDMAKVLSLKKSVSVPYGEFEDCLQTMEWTPLTRGAREFKYYAYGVGLVLEVEPRGGRGRVELIDVSD